MLIKSEKKMHSVYHMARMSNSPPMRGGLGGLSQQTKTQSKQRNKSCFVKEWEKYRF